jgi:glycosyltransferase involved in cell wall biosynthesis
MILSLSVAVAQDITSASRGLIASDEPSPFSQVLQGALGGPPQFLLEAARRIALEAYNWPAIAAQLRDLYTTILR